MTVRLLVGDCRTRLRELPDRSVHTVITSPPYFGLRDYQVEDQIGLEPTPAEFVAALVEVMGEVWRVLRDDGTLWLNLGDSYARAPSKGGRGPRGKNSAYSDSYTDTAHLKSDRVPLLVAQDAAVLARWPWARYREPGGADYRTFRQVCT